MKTPEPCECYQEISAKLKEKGLTLSDKCKTFRLSDNKLSSCIGFPLQTTEGKRIKRGQPSMIFLSYCPFCGQKYSQE